MRRQLCALLAMALLSLLVGCGETEPLPAPTVEQTAAVIQTAALPIEPWIAPPVPEGYFFNECCVKTPTYFYVIHEEPVYEQPGSSALIRVRLDDLDQQKEFPLLRTHGDNTVVFQSFRGVTPEWIYVQGVTYKGNGEDREYYADIIYRVSLDGSKAEFVATGSERDEIIEVSGPPKKPINQAETTLLSNEQVRSFATCAGWVYYAEELSSGIGAPVNLYRMKPDGTKKTLLQEKVNMDGLEAIGGKLYAMFREPIPNARKDFNDIYLCRLDSKGRIVETICESGDGFNRWMYMFCLNDKIIMCSNHYYRIYFVALYDPATEKIFTG